MAARASASGTISFGLVSIPVKLYGATSSKDVHFNMLHAKDKGRLKQQYVCSACGETVARTDTVRGYEWSRGQYVVMSDDELAALESKSDRTIEIEQFVPIASVDPVYFEKSSLLGPDKGGQKAYRLLNRAMLAAGRVAIGRFATRGRQQLVLIRPVEDGLMLHGLYYADEVRGFDEVEFGDPVELKKGELELAEQLIGQLSASRFEPGRHRDDYREAVLQAIEQKAAGEEIVAPAAPEQREQIIDLVAALKRSLETPRGAGAEAGARQRKPARAKGGKAPARGGRTARSGG
jgi:DNA end-binding protein Ku